jgi:hypothetical protein
MFGGIRKDVSFAFGIVDCPCYRFFEVLLQYYAMKLGRTAGLGWKATPCLLANALKDRQGWISRV